MMAWIDGAKYLTCNSDLPAVDGGTLATVHAPAARTAEMDDLSRNQHKCYDTQLNAGSPHLASVSSCGTEVWQVKITIEHSKMSTKSERYELDME